ncbi:DUF1659 domain-containing protein [Zhaonella formicivorans]|jgi:hypothetical protein|uniref:DUF1659 domain-containing protein n=1 Tax=Zhaonella formicivorans TaxID=2528593 RepID=UPI0010D4646B|nr:DUF1659 domain-containing protein [Zhaonella formicivorans]
MAVVVTPVQSVLRLVVQTGTDGSGNPVYRNRSYSRVKPLMPEQEVYDVAVAIAGLQTNPLHAVQLIGTSDLAQV